MLKGFEKQTEELNAYELQTLVPVLVAGLRCKVGKRCAVTNKYIVRMLKDKYRVSDVRVRKVINYIRLNALVPCLVATSDGYYVAQTEDELRDYEQSLYGRECAIRNVRLAIAKQREQTFTREPNLFNQN